jgi:hypothetical protein
MSSWRLKDYLAFGALWALLLLANWLVWKRRGSTPSLKHLWISTVLWIPGASMLAIALPWGDPRYTAVNDTDFDYGIIGSLCAVYLLQAGWQASRAAYGRISLWWGALYLLSFVPFFWIFGLLGVFVMAAKMTLRIKGKAVAPAAAPPSTPPPLA